MHAGSLVATVRPHALISQAPEGRGVLQLPGHKEAAQGFSNGLELIKLL